MCWLPTRWANLAALASAPDGEALAAPTMAEARVATLPGNNLSASLPSAMAASRVSEGVELDRRPVLLPTDKVEAVRAEKMQPFELSLVGLDGAEETTLELEHPEADDLARLRERAHVFSPRIAVDQVD